MKFVSVALAGLLLGLGQARADPRILLAAADANAPCAPIAGCGALVPSLPDTGTFVVRVVLNDIYGTVAARFRVQLPPGCALEDEDFCDSFGVLSHSPATGMIEMELVFGHPATTPTQTAVALRIHASAPGTIVVLPITDTIQARITLDGVPFDVPFEDQGTLTIGGGQAQFPCVDVVPVQATTWSLLKSRYGTSSGGGR